MLLSPEGEDSNGSKGLPGGVPSPGHQLIDAGRKVAEVAADLGISGQTIYTWRRQERIDRGLEGGLSTAERAELTAARKRIRELGTEVAVHRRATEVLKEGTDPRGGSRPPR